jgi:hypothetical protein
MGGQPVSYAINSTQTGWRAINSQADLLPGETYSDTQPALPTTAPTVSDFENAVQTWLDAGAQAWRYESILSAASYANSTVQQFKNEALALIAWRDNVWNNCYGILAAVQGGTQPMPASPAALIATLPQQPARP